MSRSTNPTAYAAIVADTFLFSGIPQEDLILLLDTRDVRVEHYEKDEVIYDRIQSEHALGILLYGSCVVTKESEGGKMPMSVLRAKDLFGAAGLFHTEREYVARVSAQESAWVLMIPEKALIFMMQQDFRVAENYMRYLTARIRFLSSRIDGFLPQNVEERVLNYIQSHAEDGVYESEWSVSALADALCVSRSTLYRAMDKLVFERKIERNGRAFRLPRGEEK